MFDFRIVSTYLYKNKHQKNHELERISDFCKTKQNLCVEFYLTSFYYYYLRNRLFSLNHCSSSLICPSNALYDAIKRRLLVLVDCQNVMVTGNFIHC